MQKMCQLMVAAAMLVVVFGCSEKSENKPESEVFADPEPEKVACLGQIVPGERIIHVGAPAGSIIDKITVHRGDQVTAGTVLASLRGLKVHEAKVAYAEQFVQVTKIDLEKIRKGERSEVVAAQEASVVAQQEKTDLLQLREKRYKRLFQSNSSSQAEYEEASAEFKMAKARLRRQQSILDEYKSGRSEEISKAEIELKLAEAQLKEAQASLELQYIKAPQDGEILDVLVFPGEILQDSGVVVYIGDTRNMMVLAEVYETDIMHVKLDARAHISSNAFGKKFGGKVVEIQHYLEVGRIFELDPAAHIDRRIVLVRIRPDQPDMLASFSNAQVSVTISRP